MHYLLSRHPLGLLAAAAGFAACLSLPVSASAQLGTLGPSTPAMVGTALGNDAAFDPVNNVYLVVSAAGSVSGVFIDGTTRQPVSAPFALNTTPEAYAHYPRAIYSPHVNGGAGGFLVTWHQNTFPPENVTHARLVSYPAGALGTDVIINPGVGGSWWVAGAAAAYSPVSQRFIVAWQSCCGGSSVIHYRMLDVNGQPIGSVMQASGGYGREPGAAWNPANNEFALSFDGADPSSAVTVVARVTVDGTLTRRNIIHRSMGTYITDIANNPATGRNVTVWFTLAGGTFAAETDTNGDVVSHGVISTTVGAYDAVSLAYNPASGTFLMVGHHATSLNVGALELNRRGARSSSDRVISSTNPQPTTGSFYPRVTSA